MGRMKDQLAKMLKNPNRVIQKELYRDHVTIQYSDQTQCRICGKIWDTNDSDPPPCEKYRDDP